MQSQTSSDIESDIWQRPINIQLCRYEMTEGKKFTNGHSQKPQQVTLVSRCAEHYAFKCPRSCTSLAGRLSGCLVGWRLGWTLWPVVLEQAGWAAVLLGWPGWLDWLGRLG